MGTGQKAVGNGTKRRQAEAAAGTYATNSANSDGIPPTQTAQCEHALLTHIHVLKTPQQCSATYQKQGGEDAGGPLGAKWTLLPCKWQLSLLPANSKARSVPPPACQHVPDPVSGSAGALAPAAAPLSTDSALNSRCGPPHGRRRSLGRVCGCVCVCVCLSLCVCFPLAAGGRCVAVGALVRSVWRCYSPHITAAALWPSLRFPAPLPCYYICGTSAPTDISVHDWVVCLCACVRVSQEWV